MSDVSVNYDAIPAQLKERDQWLLWDSSNDTPRQPHWDGDFTISWSDPDDWHSFEEARELASAHDSWGIGYVMAQDNDDYPIGLFSCLDLDGCLKSRTSPKEWLPSLEPFIDADAYIEYSPSGDGLHIPLVGQDIPEWWHDSHLTDDEHEGVDVLSNKFCTFTGDVLEDHEPDGVGAVDPTPFLYEAYHSLNGQYPRTEADEGDHSDHEDAELSREQVEEALSHLDSKCGYPKWRNIGFAVHDWDDGTTGKQVFEQWSRGAGWDEQSQRLIDAIWDRSEPGDGVTVGTLIYHAKQAGWSFGRQKQKTTDGGATTAFSDESGPDSPEGPDAEDGAASWESIRKAYRTAGDADDRLFARHEAADKLSDEQHWRNLRENDMLYAYDDEAGIFRPDGESRVRDILVEQLKEQYKAHELSEVNSQLRGRHTITKDDLGGPDTMICCENCVLKITASGVEKRDHDPKHNFIGRVQTEYDPEADCPRWERFLDEALNEETTRKKLQEFAGYTLHHWDIPHHRALFLVGPTASGKSTFLDTIRTMLGNDAVSSLTPQQMTKEKFGGAELHGAWANIRNDIPTELIENTGQFKELVAGDPIKAEKKYEDLFMFEPTAKHMFSANQLPDADTDDRAFFRRILLAAFPNEVPEEERDKHLDSKLQAEHSGILNWALEGLQRLMNNGGFTGDRQPYETEETWAKWGNSIERFEKVAIEDSKNSSLPTAEVFQAYLRFCDEEGIPSETNQQLVTKGIKSQGYQTGRDYIDGKQQRAILGADWTGRGEQLANDADDADESGQQSGLDT